MPAMPWLDALPTWLSFPIGFALLIAGAEALVRGASRMALRLGIAPLVVGLTIVAFGTSAPELAVSIGASLTGEADVAVGNVIGSNIMNVLLILGLSAMLVPLTVQSQLVRLDVPIMIAASIVIWVMSADGLIGRIEGIILTGGLLAYVLTIYLVARRRRAALTAVPLASGVSERPPAEVRIWVQVVLMVAGLLGLMIGARWLVGGATRLAEWMQISELVIGLTVVAIGTSLPEIATSVMASLRGERDIAVGNVVGSNIFNLLFVLGLTAALPPAGVSVARAAVNFDLPVMTAVAVACLPIFFTGRRISRLEGGLLVGYFVAYTSYLLLRASHHDLLEPFSRVMLLFVLPLTTAGITASVVDSVRNRRKRLSKARSAARRLP